MHTFTETRVALATVGIVAMTTLVGCASGGEGTHGVSGTGKTPREVCEAMNDTQRAVTKLDDDLTAATSNNQNEQLTNDANAVNQDLSSALASGAFVGTSVQADLQTAIHAVQQVENDLLKPDVAQAALDVGALKNAMAQLGGDCSRYLT